MRRPRPEKGDTGGVAGGAERSEEPGAARAVRTLAVRKLVVRKGKVGSVAWLRLHSVPLFMKPGRWLVGCLQPEEGVGWSRNYSYEKSL
ncbi:hypothetical protein SAMN04244547_01296 [Azotobacter vinelandii]|nr:hypothetical protein SAMN04244547_01296 [Azotobacter vinelandii]